MPYYSELGIYTSTSNSLPGPYSNHSSIIAANFTRPPPSLLKTVPRNFRGYKPHLATISENQSPLRRINSPKLIIDTPKILVQRPIKINTADIDVSINKYRKFERPKPVNDEKVERKSPSPKTESPRGSVEQKEATPNKVIKRNRRTVRIQTIHKDMLPNEANLTKSWRDNFQPEELNTEEIKRHRKTPGELLKEKFLIRSNKDEERKEVKKITRRSSKKNSVSKTPSFHDICKAISIDPINGDLNPGQPPEVQRKQSRQVSTEDILKEIKRNSGDLNKEIDIVNQRNTEILEENYDSRGSVKRKKKFTKKKSSEKLPEITDNNKSGLQRRPTLKKIKRTSTDSSVSSDIVDVETEKAYQEAIRDISQVEIETIDLRPKPVITGTVDIEEKPSLKAVIDEVQVEESPKPKKPNRFKFNFTVEDIQRRDFGPKYKEEHKGIVQLPKSKRVIVSNILKKNQRGHVGYVLGDVKEIPNKREKVTVVSQLSKTEEEQEKNENTEETTKFYSTTKSKSEEIILQKSEEIKKTSSATSIITQRSEEVEDIKEPTVQTPETSLKKLEVVKKTDSIEKGESKAVLLEEDKKSETPQTSPKKSYYLWKSASATAVNAKTEDNQKVFNNANRLSTTPRTSLREFGKSEEKVNEIKNATPRTSTKKNDNESRIDVEVLPNQLRKDESSENFWDQIGSRESVYISQRRALKHKEEDFTPHPLISEQEKEETLITNDNEKQGEVQVDSSAEVKKALPSKRSLVNKANKDDPDLEVFVPPEPQPEPEPEPKKDVFVPLQSNRLSQWMHPFKKPEHYNECPVEIWATPKTIRTRHYPKPRHPEPQPVQESESEEESEESSEEDTSSDDEYDVNVVYGSKVGASTSSNDSGFDSGAPGSGNKGSLETRDSPSSNPALNPAFALDSNESSEEYSQSSTLAGFQKSGRITPPATTIPRFRKYCLDDFNFLKVLGKGSFGKVLLAELKNTEYYYAVKCLKKDVVLEDDDVECTLIERKVLALGTKHPYLCHLLCTFQTESHLFFVMEYLNGGDLMFHIQQSGRFEEPRARFYAAEIVSGLKFLHSRGIVYRDLKLDNILLDFDGHVRIADFGMCKLQVFLDRMADTFCGTPDYMAPEIIKGQHYNQNVDWWSFGVLLYEMLIGQSPFSGCDEDELFWSICNEKPVLPRFLTKEASAILMMFLEKDANKRLGNRFCPHGEIQDQPFFKPIQWDRLEARQLEPPFKPNLQHPLDTQYFDKTFTVEKAKLTPIDQNILQSMDQTQFQGFSYTNPNATDK